MAGASCLRRPACPEYYIFYCSLLLLFFGGEGFIFFEQVAVAVEGEMEETQNWLKGYLGLGPPYWVSLATQTPDIAWGLVALE